MANSAYNLHKIRHLQRSAWHLVNKERIKYWVDLAEYDLESAKVMLKGKRYLYVGFLCHQTIEKILKAYYVFFKKQTPPHIHNLTLLAKKSKIYLRFSERQKDIIDTLEPLNIETRYPTYKEKLLKSLNEERSKKILRETKELYQWIKRAL